MSNVQLFYTAIAALIGMATAILGWFYSRRVGLTAAQTLLANKQKEVIEAMHELLAVRDLKITDLDLRLVVAEKRLTKAYKDLRALKKRMELIG